MKKNNSIIKHTVILILLLTISQLALAQTGGPGPPPLPPVPPATGAPIDGLSGVLIMIASALFGKKYFNKEEQ